MEPTKTTVVDTCMEEWRELDKEFLQLETNHENYKKNLEELRQLQKKCLSGIAHHRYRTKQIQDSVKRAGKIEDPEQKATLKELQLKIQERKTTFREMEEVLPHKNGLYLSIILGQVNVSLLNKEDKYAYKHDYETFKVTVSYITLALSVLLLMVRENRWLDAVLHFLLVWYYCTLTIRENILIVNGSRIKGWWVTHHFISTAGAAINLIWPHGYSYQVFRTQNVLFSLYLSILYVLQFFYQKGCLYRLRSLGQRHDMDITVEGFMSWMWKGISFLLPFLFAGYFFQMYNSYVLYKLSYHPECTDWQTEKSINVPVLRYLCLTSCMLISEPLTSLPVFVLALIHFVLSVGNIMTTLKVVYDKLLTDTIKASIKRMTLTNKYRFNSNSKTI